MDDYSYRDESVASQEALLEKDPKSWTQPKKASNTLRVVALFVHLGFIGLYTAILLWSWHYIKDEYAHGPRLTYNPAREAINYDTQIFDHTQVFFNVTPKPFSGLPRPQLDDAWEDLLQYFNIRISEDEMKRLGKLENAIALPDGGYFGSLTVYHQLHCVWRLHQAIYPKYYWADLSDEEAFLNLGHSEHCLDVMRQSILCNADTSITTMKWGHHQASPLADSSNVHECVNWDSITEWAAPRSFDPFKPGYLMHPHLGAAFADERGSRLGVAVESDNPHFHESTLKKYLEFTAR